MIRCTRFTSVLSVLALASIPFGALGQQPTELGRFTVLVPDLEPLASADRNFGRDLAEELRDLLNTLATHEAISRRDIERSLDEVDRDMDEVDCTLARQLAARIDARVVLCASYEEVERDRFLVSATFYDVRSGEAFGVEPTTRSDREEELAARHIFDQFDTYTRQLSAAANCESYAQSQLWEDALRNCDLALALNPEAIGARYRRARILFDSERLDESMEELQRVLEQDPIHENALQLAGFISGTLERTDQAVAYYTRFLQLDPDNAFVRMRVAFDLARASNLDAALVLIREGLDLDPDNIDMWEQLGGYSFSIGEDINRSSAPEDSGAVTPDAVPYFEDAIAAYERVFEARGADTNPAHLRGIVTAYLRLGRIAEAMSVAEAAVDAHADDAPLWSVYADALRRGDRLDTALQALNRVEEIDSTYPNLGLRRGTWLIEAGRIEEAVETLTEVALREPERADGAARLVLRDAHENGVQEERYDYAIKSVVLAKTIPNLSATTIQELNFWQGYSALRAASVEQEPRTVESARATLPKFEAALELLSDVGDYPSSVNVNIEALRANIETFIEIQQAIIRRGG